MRVPNRRTSSRLAVLLALALAACGGDGGGPQGLPGGGGGDTAAGGGGSGAGDGPDAGGEPAGDGGTVVTPPTIQRLLLGTGRIYAAVGVAQRLTAVAQYSDGSSKPLASGVSWASSDGALATVDPTGLVTPWTEGGVTLTATDVASGLSATAELSARVVVPLQAGTGLPATRTVDTTVAFFQVSGLTPGAMYRPQVSRMTDDVDLEVYSDLSMTSGAMLCQSDTVGMEPEACTAPATSRGELWIAVDGEWTRAGATFVLDVPPAQPAAIAATLAYPAQLPWAGSIGRTVQLYELDGLAPGAAYELRISKLTADIDLEVFADPYEYASLCQSYQSGTVDDFCVAHAGGDGRLFVQIDGETTSDGGGFTLSVTATP